MKPKVHKCKNISHPFPVVAWLIMICQGMLPWMKNAFSHMCIQYGDYFYNIRFSGYEKMHKTEFLEVYELIESHEFEQDVDFDVFKEWISNFVYHKYDFVQIGGLLLKALGFISFNKIGYDFRKMICSELPLAFIVDFYGHKVEDSDDYDLISTWSALLKY